MKKVYFIFPLLFLSVTVVIWVYRQAPTVISPVVLEKPLDKFSIENLRKRGGISSQIIYDDEKKFHYFSDGRKVTGVYYKPTKPNGKIIVLLHGSADEGEYFPGFGTDHVAKELVKNGYTTYAPDFLGYGGSDKGTDNDFENRFLTWTTNMDLIASLEAQNSKIKTKNSKQNLNLEFGTWNLYLWGHSNGGQIAFSILAITGWDYPTVLWNPVTKPFPYNILYFTDGYKDEGRWLRKATADFEKDYDVDKYSFDKYLEGIKAPILLQQGEADEWVPIKWSRDINSKLQTKNSKVIYKEYSGADHNMNPKWNEAVKDLLNFYSKQ